MHAWDKWNSKPFLVTTEKYELEAKQLLEGSFHEIEHVTRIVNWKKIRDLHEAEKKAHFLKIDIVSDNNLGLNEGCDETYCKKIRGV